MLNKSNKNHHFLLLILFIPGIGIASGTAEQYMIIWMFILSPIWVPLLIWLIYILFKYIYKWFKEPSIQSVQNIQKTLTKEEEKEKQIKHKKLFIEANEILINKGYSIRPINFGWEVTAPNGARRKFYDIDFLYSFALVQKSS